MNRKQRRAGQGNGQSNGKGTRSQPLPQKGIVETAALRSAESLLAQKKWGEAAAVYKSVLATSPRNPTALYNLGALLAGFHDGTPGALPEDLEAAGHYFSRYIQLVPDDADALAALGFVRLGQGRRDDALAFMSRAQAGRPLPKTLSRMGYFYREAGEDTRARDCFTAALAAQPDMASAWQGLAGVQKLAAGTPEFERLLALDSKRDALAVNDRIYLDFALARAYLGQGDTDAAFVRYAAGNQQKRGTYPGYDIARFEGHADNIASLFSPDFIDRFRGQGRGGKGSIFIIGMPRSGSTLVDQILCSHPAAASVGESPFLNKSLVQNRGAELPGLALSDGSALSRNLVSSMSGEILAGISKKYRSFIRDAGTGRAHVVDKMLFNFLWVGIIRLAMPDAKIIHCTRDARDIGLSIWQLLFAADLPWAYDLSETGRYYNAYKKIMAHWDSVFSGEIFEANYETMVAQQEDQTRRLLAFCGLDWDDACLHFHETKRNVATASHAQVRKPIYGDSVAKWKKYEKHLGPLIAALKK